MKGISSVELVEVIKIRTVIGNGSKEDPVREVIQYWDKTGKKLLKKMIMMKERGERNVQKYQEKDPQKKYKSRGTL